MLIASSFKPAWWLANAHLQTIYPTFCRKLPRLSSIKRERLLTPDHDFIDIDWCGSGKSPIVILLHGLSGSASSSYILGLQHALWQLGWRSVALNFRGCSGEYNHTARCYHSGDTDDLELMYQSLRRREPATPIAAAGFSLGGNILLKWLGERQQKPTLFAAVAVSVPLLLNVCSTRLDKGLSRLYRQRLLFELKKYVQHKHAYLLSLNKSQEAEKLARLGPLDDITSFWQYDARVVARLYGFRDAHDYYHRSSSRQFLRHIKVPTLIIQAQDDPFMTAEVLPEPHEISAHVDLEIAASGGHVGFIAGAIPGKAEYWLERRIPEYFLQHAPAN